MARQSPLNAQHREHEASFLRFGQGDTGAEVVETFGPLEPEYAAIRRGCALFDMAQRATVIARGPDTLDFLDRMLTQRLRDVPAGSCTRSFWLNRKGRIDADVRAIADGAGVTLDMDTLCVERFMETLDAFLLADDMTLEDATERVARLVLAGPTARALLERCSSGTLPDAVDRASVCSIGGVSVLVDRHDATGGPCYDLHVPVDETERVWSSLLEAGERDEALRLRRAGWHAYNIARIEAGTALYHLDFGPESLPAETGVLRERVDFKKGCYLGQEVVARMDALGHPKRTLVAFRLPSADAQGPEHQPMTGAPVYAPSADPAASDPIGAVTSSTRSPMLGDDVCCFAQVKWAHASAGSELLVMTGAGPMAASVREHLRFWAQSEPSSIAGTGTPSGS